MLYQLKLPMSGRFGSGNVTPFGGRLKPGQVRNLVKSVLVSKVATPDSGGGWVSRPVEAEAPGSEPGGAVCICGRLHLFL